MSVPERWGRAAARRRFASVGPVMWSSMPVGLSVMGAVNLVQLVAHWPVYRDGRVALGVLIGLSAMVAVVWWRAPHGVGPLLSATALAAGPVACLVIATQLSPVELTGLANFVSGFSVVPVLLLPFARPAEELALGIAGLVAAQAWTMAGAGGSIRDLHSVVLSAGAAPAIAIGAAIVVSAMRFMVTTGERIAARARAARWRRTIEERGLSSRSVTIGRTELVAAELLEAIAAGTLSPGDPEVVERSARIARTLRTEVWNASQRSLLAALVNTPTDATSEIPSAVEVDDEDNLAARLAVDDRLLLTRALREAATAGARVQAKLFPVNDDRALVIVNIAGAPPDTADWATLRARPDASVTVDDGAWFYDEVLRLNRTSWEP